MQPVELYKGSTIFMSFAFTPVGGVTPSLTGVTPTVVMKKPDGTLETIAISNLVAASGTFDVIRQTTDLPLGRYRFVVTFDTTVVDTLSDPIYIQLIDPL